MPAALIHRTRGLRLRCCAWIPLTLPIRSRQVPWPKSTSRLYGHSAQNGIERHLDSSSHDVSLPDTKFSSPGHLLRQQPEAPIPRATTESQGQNLPDARKDRRQETREAFASQKPPNIKPDHTKLKPYDDFFRAQKVNGKWPGNFLGKQRLYITRERVNQSITSDGHPQNRFSFRDKARKMESLSVAAMVEKKRLRGMYAQWGYIRHQYPDSERLAARRIFNAWKTKFWNIMAPIRPVYPSAWPWRHDADWLLKLNGVAAMQKAWEALDEKTRAKAWTGTMLSALYSRPQMAHMVLAATLNPLPPGYAIHDSLSLIAERFHISSTKSLRERTLQAEEILETISKVLENVPVGHVPLGQRTYGLLSRKLPPAQARELYNMLQSSNAKLHPNTQLHFARKLADEMEHKDLAFEILKGLAETGIDLNAPSPSSTITALLHCRILHGGWSEEQPSFSAKDALEYFMERGFVPNVINATAFLDSLCQQSEVDEAIRLALLFSESGVHLDTKAWATIFRGAKHSLNVSNVLRSFDVAKAANVPLTSVLNNALHAIFYFAELESRDKKLSAPWIYPLFGPMLRAYAKRFELEPLQLWLPDSLPIILTQTTGDDGDKFESHRPRRWEFLESIYPLVESFFSSTSQGLKLKPDTTTIAIMLRAYIKTLQHPYDLMAFYSFFKSRLEEYGGKDGYGTCLMKDQGSLIHDTIIMAMTERRGLSRPALQVFGDMLKDHLQRTTLENGDTEGPIEQDHNLIPIHPPPGICTFSILVRGLMNSGDRILADQFIQVMKEQGVEPNLITWNTLIKGYAAMQNMNKTVSALQDMEAAGFKPDLFTFKAFGKLKDQAKALEMMESIITVNRQKMAGEDLYE